ncbi:MULTISPECIES: WD40 repeat domain-containing protein [unclassified Anabaena]|uniref:WD40 repeat domain-containing protein n=1 Tax=unclassified Anabaena TaxID=2619674 RepID=UPI000AC9268E|nr:MULTISPECIES: WD40 repeat domain-containing protein [unclassified Anabaena]
MLGSDEVILDQDIANQSDQLFLERQNRPCDTLLATLTGHTRAVLAIAFSPDAH